MLLLAPRVVGLKGPYSLCDDLKLCVRPVGGSLVLNDYQEDVEGCLITEKAHVRPSNTSGLTANGERNAIMRRCNGRTLVEV